jgi:hypothetical protein
VSTPDVPCGHYLGAEGRHCGNTPTRRYITGNRCAADTPAAVAERAADPNPSTLLPEGALR